jgi:fructose-bisphosphate aldolase, class II
MPLISSHDLHQESSRLGASVVAFNVIGLEHIEAIVVAAEETGIPVIAQLSENAIRHRGSPDAIAAAMSKAGELSSAEIVLHLDHITDVDLAKRAADLGFSSIMWDSSHLDYADNVEATRAITAWGHERGIWVESELGAIGGKGGAHAPGVRTDPTEAHSFVLATGVDSLAVAVGSSHAMTEKTAELDVDLITDIAQRVPVPLVLHGSTGVPEESLRQATKAGMWKINIGTALNISATSAVREVLEKDPHLTDPRKYLGPARDQMAATIASYLRLLSLPLTES